MKVNIVNVWSLCGHVSFQFLAISICVKVVDICLFMKCTAKLGK
jgi:hypothetical protein